MGNQVVDAILGATPDPNIRAAMLLGSHLESSWSLNAVGDHGTSFGPFQIHLPAHPGVSSVQAENAAFAVNYMLPAYRTAAQSIPSAQWKSDPKGSARLAAFRAERPAQIYPESRVDSAWPDVLAAIGGKTDFGGGAQGGGGTPPPVGGGSTDPFTAITNAIGDAFKPLTDIGNDFAVFGKLLMPETWVRIMAGVLGIAMLVFGVVKLTNEVKG